MTQMSADWLAQDLLDKEIAVVQATLCALKKRRNTHSSIARLPDDVLALIFLEARPTRAFWWSIFNEVCTHWRTVAINTPQLWTQINFNSTRQARCQLQWAKSAPLDVCYELQPSWTESDRLWSLLTELIRPNHRFRTLSLRTSKSEPVHLFLKTDFLHSQAALLERLRIQAEREGHRALPATTRLGSWHELPKLTHFYLDFPMPMKIPFLPSLTHFECLSHNLTVSTVLRALKCMPLIEDVSIYHIQFNADDTPPTIPIILPSLKGFKILAMQSSSSRIFTSLDIPPTAKVKACLYGDDELDLPRVHALLTQFYESMAPLSTDDLKLKVGIGYSTVDISFSSTTRDGERIIQVSESDEVDNRLRILDPLPIETFTSMICDVKSNFELIDILLLRFIHLRKLDLQFSSEKAHISVLWKLRKADAYTSLLLPELEHLCGVFSTRHCVRALETLLYERRDLGIPLKTIATSQLHKNAVDHLPEHFGLPLIFF